MSRDGRSIGALKSSGFCAANEEPPLDEGKGAAMYTYIKSEPQLWTVGHEDHRGKWHPESDHPSKTAAAERTAWLNGGGVNADAKLADVLSECRRVLDWRKNGTRYSNEDFDVFQGLRLAVERASK